MAIGSRKESLFLGGAYQARSPSLAVQRCVNLYLEVVESRDSVAPAAFYNTPGLDLTINVGNGPIRAMQRMGGNLYVVSGDKLYKLDPGFNPTLLGTLTGTVGARMDSMANNTQAAFVDSQTLYVTDGTQIIIPSLPFSGPFTCDYQDSFGLIGQSNSNVWWQTNSFDFTTINGLNFSSADGRADNIVGIQMIHREMFLFKQFETEVWVDAGNAGFAFQRLDGVFIESGLASPYALCKANDSIFWVGQNSQGDRSIYMSRGYQPERISTHAIEFQLGQYSTVADAFAYSYRQEGHTFVVFTFPTGDATWVYDMIDSPMAKMHLWHQRAAFSQGQFHRHQSNNYVFFSGLHLVGDYQNGNIYAMDLDTFTDNGQQRKWVRSWLSEKPTNRTQRYDELRIKMDSGIEVPDDTNPQMMLRWSDDGGYTWSNERFLSVGKIGVTAAPTLSFKRLGTVKRNVGTERTFEISSTDQFKVGLIGAEVR